VALRLQRHGRKLILESRLQIFSTSQKLGQSAARYVAQISQQSIAARGRFTVALSGGSLPKIICPPLVADPLKLQINWSDWHVFWADERCVPLDHPDSSYRLSSEYLFEQVDIPAQQIYPIDASLPVEKVADAYEKKLRQLFQAGDGQFPSFDLILLGMGEDGHTASLFPGHPLLNESKRWVAPIFNSPKPPPERITLTLPVINQAHHVAFLVTGAGKADALSHIFQTESPPNKLPAQMVQPVNGQLRWFVDNAAAARLKTNGSQNNR